MMYDLELLAELTQEYQLKLLGKSNWPIVF